MKIRVIFLLLMSLFVLEAATQAQTSCWPSGSLSNVTVDEDDHLVLSDSNLTGDYTSPVVDYGALKTFTDFAWSSVLPYYKELPITSESTSDYSGLSSSSLTTGLQALYHMNESNGSVYDATSNNHDSVLVSGVTYNVAGKLQSGFRFTGSAASAILTSGWTGVMSGTSVDLTFSTWFKSSAPIGDCGMMMYMGGTSNNGIGLWQCGNGIGFINQSGNTFTTNIWNDGNWHHLVGTHSVSEGKDNIYVDGALVVSESKSINIANVANNLTIGTFANGQFGYTGDLDEVAVWDRALDATEVAELYQRGGNRIKFQVRSCNDASCTGEAFSGPDGSSSTYYTELNNNSNQFTMDGTVADISPEMDFSNFGFSRPANNRYWQFKAFLERDSTAYNTEASCVSTTTASPTALPVPPASCWSNGTLSDVVVNVSDSLTLSGSNLTGDYTSPIIDYGSNTTFTNLGWSASLPYNKELPITSENISDYPSLYSSSLTTGLQALYHMNEASGHLIDSSGNGRDTTSETSLTYSSSGRLQSSISFGGSSYATTDSWTGTTMSGNADITMSTWFNSTASLSGNKGILFYGGSGNGVDDIVLYQADTQIGVYIGVAARLVNNTYSDGNWHLIAVTYKASTGVYTLYIDGENKKAGVIGPLNTSTFVLRIADTPWGSKYEGLLDEVSMWSRPLEHEEIRQLYQRGSNRAKFQVRSCDDSACSGESWLGPDGSSDTYFTELNNNADQENMDSTVLTTPPNIDFSNFSLLTIPSNQWWQYKSFLERDDTATNPEIICSSTLPELVIASATKHFRMLLLGAG